MPYIPTSTSFLSAKNSDQGISLKLRFLLGRFLATLVPPPEGGLLPKGDGIPEKRARILSPPLSDGRALPAANKIENNL